MGEKMTLLPCPFCGHAELFDEWPCEWLDGSGANVVRCPMCHGAAPAKYWNTRHLTQPAQAVDVTDADIAAWAERHDLGFGGSMTDARCAFEDAQTFTAALPNANGKEG